MDYDNLKVYGDTSITDDGLVIKLDLLTGNFKNIDKVSISNNPLGGIDKAMMDDVKRDWEE